MSSGKGLELASQALTGRASIELIMRQDQNVSLKLWINVASSRNWASLSAYGDGGARDFRDANHQSPSP